MKRSTAAIAVLVFLVSFSYFASFRAYGLQLEDEGTLLFQLDRVSRGDRPYLDFATGYTPGYFRVGSALLDAAGGDVPTLRVFIALVNAASAAAMYLIAAPIGGAVLALIPPLAWVAMIPVFAGDFASFNIPYPAWFAALCYLFGALAMRSFALHGGITRVVVVGVIAAAAFSFKVNAGAFLLAASTFVVCATARRETFLDRVAATAAVAFMAGAIALTFLIHPTAVDLSIHLVPLLAVAAIAGVLRTGELAAPGAPRILFALAALAVGFLAPTAIWALPTLRALGVEGFVETVLLLGSGAASVYYEGHPAPEPYAVVVTLCVVALSFGLARRAYWRRALLAVAGIAAAIAVTLTSGLALMPTGLAASVGLQLENAIFWLAPIFNAAGIAAVLAATRDRATSAGLFVATSFAVTMYLQLYPRTDFMHVVMAVPATLCLAAGIAARLVRGAEPANGTAPTSSSRLEACLLVAVAAVCVLRIGPGVARANTSCDEARGPAERVALCVERASGDDLAAFRKTVSYLARHTEPREAVLAFPALNGALFGAARTSPVPHDYWFPGRPNVEEEAAMLSELRRSPPRFVVTLNSGWGFFIRAPEYFHASRQFVLEHYRLVARFERFDVLARRDVSAPTETDVATEPAGGLEAITVQGDAERRQGMRRILSGLTPEAARVLELPTDPTRAVLALRAVRDAGDMRAVGLAVQGYSRDQARVRKEAVGAMYLVTSTTRAALARWAGDVAPADFRPYLEPWLADLQRLTGSTEKRVRDFAELALELHGPT